MRDQQPQYLCLYQNSNFAPTISLFTFHASKLARGSRGLFRIINGKHRKNWNSKIVCRFYREVARSKPQIGLNKMLCISHHIPYILIVQTLKHCLCVSLREREDEVINLSDVAPLWQPKYQNYKFSNTKLSVVINRFR